MKAFIGILIYLGAQQISKVNVITLWEPLIGEEICRATMSKNRFFRLLRVIRFDDKESRRNRQQNDSLAPISEIFSLYLANLQRHYVPGMYLTV